ncbi:MAG: NAD-dependent epimerase/dehydratase family protein, partial [Cytophagales bacterium]|nr:NAD-dependent epimerase/dehydratase family protein [Cytophagales bacterium]
YMYDRNFLNPMTENTPIRPTSKKGEVRAQIAKMITDGISSGKLTALIARSADFYGPNNDKSVLIETVHKNFAKGKPADWFASLEHVHTFTYTPDAAMATALLGNTPDAYNQVWHVPTDNSPLKGKDWVGLFAREMGIPAKARALPLFIHKIIGWFVPIMNELYEMAYQYDRDYVFSSEKFEKRFGIKPTSPEEGVKKTVAYYKNKNT